MAALENTRLKRRIEDGDAPSLVFRPAKKVAVSVPVPITGKIEAKAYRSTAVNAAVTATRQICLKMATEEGELEMKLRMKYIMQEIDVSCGEFICGATSAFQFMDVCCAPGGFSEYTLDHSNSHACGIGFSLPPELGGHMPCIVTSEQRYHMHLQDVTTIAPNIRCSRMSLSKRPPATSYTTTAAATDPPTPYCSLVILDGSFLGGKDWIVKEASLPDSENPAFNVYRSNQEAHLALVVAQLIVMANVLEEKGTLVLRLCMHADLFTCGVLCLLRRVFDGHVAAYKPRSCHVVRSSYYLVAKGFNVAKAQQLQWRERFITLLADLRSGGFRPRTIPFPQLPEGTLPGLCSYWKPSLLAYHGPLWRFHCLVCQAVNDKDILDKQCDGLYRPREGRFTAPCWRRMLKGGCMVPRCPSAHNYDELHPFAQQAFKEPLGLMFMPEVVPPELVRQVDPMGEIQAELSAGEEGMAQILAAQAAAAAGKAGAGRRDPRMQAKASTPPPLASFVPNSYAHAEASGWGGEWVRCLYQKNAMNIASQPQQQSLLSVTGVLPMQASAQTHPAKPAAIHGRSGVVSGYHAATSLVQVVLAEEHALHAVLSFMGA